MQNGRFTIILAIFLLALILISHSHALSLPITHEIDAPHLPTSCEDISSIPTEECLALVQLFEETDGPNWTTNSHWLDYSAPTAPCNWHGVACDSGHVIALDLSNNGLSGSLPRQIRQFDGLAELNLASNALVGRVPLTICDLADTVETADFGYNGFYTKKRATRNCLEQLDSDWQATQTVAPAELQFANFAADSLTLQWEPIAYQADEGHYRVGISEDINGPFAPAGETADKQTTALQIDGLNPGTTYYFRVQTITSAHAQNPNELASEGKRLPGVTLSADTSILLIGYVPFDNNLSGYINEVVERIRFGSSLNPNIQAVLLVDGRQENDTTLMTISKGEAVRTDIVEQHWGVDELNTSDPDVLAWFLSYARENYPANIEIVSLMGHGIALTPEVIWPEPEAKNGRLSNGHSSTNPIPPLPRVVDFTPGDVTSRDFLSTIDVGTALAAATDNGTNPFDILFLDQCFQGNLDTLYELRNAADVFIGSPSYAWLAAPYDKYLVQLAPATTPEEMAQNIIDRYQGTLNNQHPNAIFWATRETIVAVADALSVLGDHLQTAVSANETNGIFQAAQHSQFVDTNQCEDRQFELSPPDELIGAETFARNLQQAFPEGDAHGIYDAAANLRLALSQISSRSRSGQPHIAPDKTWTYGDTLTILAPLRRNSPADVAWRASIYKDEADITAVWSLAPDITATLPQPFAYVQEGRWDDFLATWYTHLDTPTLGGWCHYIPPSRLEFEDLEPLTLELTAEGIANASLNWTATTDETAVRYVLFVNGAGFLNWTFWESYGIGETAVLQTDLLPNQRYRFRIAATDAEGNIIALSNEASIGFSRVYLPLLHN